MVGLSLLVALGAAGSASATPIRPALTSLPFSQISAAAAKAAHQTPLCPPNGGTIVCYSPSFLRDAYDFPTGRNTPTGAGQTILIVTAYGSPFIQQDIAQFDAENGLPDPPSFTIVNQQTQVTDAGSGDFLTWAIETSLDVEYAHGMAPGANIVLAVGGTDDSTNIAQLESEVLPQYPRAIVSQSFGTDEAGLASDPDSAGIMDKLFFSQVLHGGTVVAAWATSVRRAFVVGPPQPDGRLPGVEPIRALRRRHDGRPDASGLWNRGHYGGEQAWNELLPSVFPGWQRGGGAPSTIFCTALGNSA